MTNTRASSRARRSAALAGLLLFAAVSARAQQASGTPALGHPKVCANGVKEYSSRAELPAVFDSLTMPPSEPVRVTSPEEAAAAQDMMRERAGSVGATGLLAEEVSEETANGIRISRSLLPIFAPSDTSRAYAACRKQGSTR